jgi:hypothetical protein
MAEPTVERAYEQPLFRFWRSLSPEGKAAFAAACQRATGTTTAKYLQQMMAQAVPNPTLRLALAIESESLRLYRQGVAKAPPVVLTELLIGRIMTKLVKDHTTGEVFAMLPDGKLVRRRLDKEGRIVMLDDDGQPFAIENSFPTKKELSGLGAVNA